MTHLGVGTGRRRLHICQKLVNSSCFACHPILSPGTGASVYKWISTPHYWCPSRMFRVWAWTASRPWTRCFTLTYGIHEPGSTLTDSCLCAVCWVGLAATQWFDLHFLTWPPGLKVPHRLSWSYVWAWLDAAPWPAGRVWPSIQSRSLISLLQIAWSDLQRMIRFDHTA